MLKLKFLDKTQQQYIHTKDEAQRNTIKKETTQYYIIPDSLMEWKRMGKCLALY
jgi:hypothetical protein